jgi:hypothetical protein
MKCPNCGLINPESAQRCDCGYDFYSNRIEQSYLFHKPNKDEKQIFVNLIKFFSIPCLIVSIALTIDCIIPAASCNRYFVRDKKIETQLPETPISKTKKSYVLILTNPEEMNEVPNFNNDILNLSDFPRIGSFEKSISKSVFDKILKHDRIEVYCSFIFKEWKHITVTREGSDIINLSLSTNIINIIFIIFFIIPLLVFKWPKLIIFDYMSIGFFGIICFLGIIFFVRLLLQL